MAQLYINNSPQVREIGAAIQPGTVGDAELEQTVGVSLLADYNEQLNAISQTMQNNLAQKKDVREEIYELETMKTLPTKDVQGQSTVELTVEQAQKLNVAQSAMPIKNTSGQVTGYYLQKDTFADTVDAAVKNQEQKLAGLNSTSELTMLQIQSLVDQRKNALMLLSNLMASKNETAMSIIRNMKN